jgi:MFS family permease
VKKRLTLSPYRVLFPVAIGTCLSLLGDASLYTVLPTHTAAAGVTVASVGILLSANRFIRLVLNGPAGMAYDRWRRRPLFVSALFVGALSTAIYGLSEGFWPLLLGRLLWGLAWSGIWVGGNTIVLDVASDDSRGRWVGFYQLSFFLGVSAGALLGGLLTDMVGYHQAMVAGAALTFVGAIIALVFLPETREFKQEAAEVKTDSRFSSFGSKPAERTEFATATALYAVNRLAVTGFLQSTLGFFLLERMGAQVQIAGRVLGVATVTGLGLSLSTLIAMASSPVMGAISDRVGNRWRAAAGGLTAGVVGFSLLAVGAPLTTLLGIPLVAITSGSNQGLSTALIGDLGNRGRQSQRLGVLFTVGDLTAAIGPPLAYALMPSIGIKNVYWLSAGLFASMFLITLRRANRLAQNVIPIEEN